MGERLSLKQEISHDRGHHKYTQLLEDARRHAVDRMVANAAAMEANAIVRMMFDSSEIGQTMSEIVAYGTAVVIEPDQKK
jgi:uncharacterized protein YbjQ (UPF0145 family)